MEDPEQHALVYGTLVANRKDCILWRRVPEQEMARDGHKIKPINTALSQHLKTNGPKALRQKRPTPQESEAVAYPVDFLYSTVMPYGDYARGLYIKAILQYADGEASVAIIVSAHGSSF